MRKIYGPFRYFTQAQLEKGLIFSPSLHQSKSGQAPLPNPTSSFVTMSF